jgi:hypothetical protein
LLRLGLGAELSNGSRREPTRPTGLSRSTSVLKELDGAVGPVPRVLLRDTETEPETPVVRPSLGAVPIEPSGRYQLLGEIARGGMGAILKGRDTDLGRDLAGRSSSTGTGTTPSWSAGSSRRRRSAASSSTPGLRRSTSWGRSPTSDRSSP